MQAQGKLKDTMLVAMEEACSPYVLASVALFSSSEPAEHSGGTTCFRKRSIATFVQLSPMKRRDASEALGKAKDWVALLRLSATCVSFGKAS